MAIICLLYKLTNAFEKGEIGLGIFIDFRKAFDTVDHEILLDKLYYYGIRGHSLDWLRSYLCGRKQFVEYDGNMSKGPSTNHVTHWGGREGQGRCVILLSLTTNFMPNLASSEGGRV